MRFPGRTNTIYNPAPLPLVLAVLTFGFGVFLLKKVFLADDNPHTATLVAFGLVFNPFLLLSLVFQLDCLGFALSLVLLLVPFALVPASNRKERVRYHGGAALLVFLSLNCYQAALGFFMSLAVIELVHGVYRNSYDIKTLYGRMSQLIAGFVLYKLFLKLPFIANVARKPSRVEFVDVSAAGFNAFLNNIRHLAYALISSLSQMQILALSLLFALSVVFVVAVFLRKYGKSRGTERLLLYMVLLSPLLTFLFSFLPLSFLNYPVEGKKFMFVSFSGFTLFLFFSAHRCLKRSGRAFLVLAPVVLLGFGFSYNMANLIKSE